MKKNARSNRSFWCFFIFVGIFLSDLLVQGLSILLFDDTVPKEQTLNYQLEQMLFIVADKMRETGELPKNLDDVSSRTNIFSVFMKRTAKTVISNGSSGATN